VTPFISIIIPCRNEERYIEQCLTSLINSTYPKESFEVLVVDGMSGDDTRRIIENYHTTYHFIHLIDNPERTTPHALNRGIRHAKGDYIIILSAHADYPPNYCEKLVTSSITLNADCTGPLLKTKTIHKSNSSNAIINALSDPFGVGSRFRTGATVITEVDTVAFGCYSKKTFEKYGLFDERLIRNQDIELNKRITRGGGKIYLLPDVQCTYYARETYIDLAKNNYQNGYWNILTAYYTGTLRSLSLRHFVPLGFVLALIVPILLSPLYTPMLCMSITVALLYLALIGWRASRIKKNTTWTHQLWAFISLHFSYGFGSIGGIIALTKKILFKDYQ
jgi:glycosyltransferase involved in cell wall biosynthesis